MNPLKSFLQHARSFADLRSRAAAELEQLKQQRDELETAPLPKADFAALIERYIDAQLAVFDANVAAAVDRLKHRPNVDFEQMRGGFPLLQMMDGSGQLDERLLVALLADAVKGRVRAALNRMDWPVVGLPLAARPAARQRLDAAIEAAERTILEMDAAAQEAGVKVQANGR